MSKLTLSQQKPNQSNQNPRTGQNFRSQNNDSEIIKSMF
jgi:hypothetical protein